MFSAAHLKTVIGYLLHREIELEMIKGQGIKKCYYISTHISIHKIPDCAAIIHVDESLEMKRIRKKDRTWYA